MSHRFTEKRERIEITAQVRSKYFDPKDRSQMMTKVVEGTSAVDYVVLLHPSRKHQTNSA